MDIFYPSCNNIICIKFLVVFTFQSTIGLKIIDVMMRKILSCVPIWMKHRISFKYRAYFVKKKRKKKCETLQVKPKEKFFL